VPSYAGFADGRGVDEGSQFLCECQLLALVVSRYLTYLNVFAQQSVEQMYVGRLKMDEVLELLDRRRLHGQEPEAYGRSAIGTQRPTD
jgi:hypothetical protein